MKIIITTCEPHDAPSLLRSLLEKRVVACGNIISQVRSMYWWDGKIQDDAEVLIVMETTDEKVDLALSEINKQHPYRVPKILAWEPSHTNAPYLQWLQKETQS
ncbi:MAG: divalent-cation tolerance protein CutA [Myxococcota bacterium]|nr:divalent-cation tolerance protein CutA [Myxococcota bacterium]